MPLKAINYDKTHFYRIVCKDLDIKECYVGHTTDFNTRKCQHKHDSIRNNSEKHNIYVYEFIRENGGWDNWDMVLIKTEKCDNEIDAKSKERYYIEQYKASLNKIKRPYISEEEKKELYKEYYGEHREDILEQKKDYYQDKREERLKYKQEYYERERDNILERKREKKLENIEEERRKDRERYHKHKEKYLAKDKEKVECECGVIVCRSYLTAHKKTNKHLQYLQNQSNPQ